MTLLTLLSQQGIAPPPPSGGSRRRARAPIFWPPQPERQEEPPAELPEVQPPQFLPEARPIIPGADVPKKNPAQKWVGLTPSALVGMRARMAAEAADEDDIEALLLTL